MALTRRGFFGGLAAAAGLGLARRTAAETPPAPGADVAPGALDPCAIGVITDIHTALPWSRQKYRTGREYPYLPGKTQDLVKEILARPHPPATVIGLGDLSIAFGEEGDYEIAAAALKPLTDAGIAVVHTMGNHDIRAEFLKHFPGYDKTTKVPGRFVSVVETPHCDFILLDSLKEPDKRGSYKAVTGRELGAAQTAWLKETLAAAQKPTFVCAHHMAGELGIERLCAQTPAVVGYLHGHHHHWMTNYLSTGYQDDARTVRMMGFPSFGLDRDIGWGLLRTSPRGAVLECHNRDYYFPAPRKPEDRPASWDGFIRDWDGRRIEFPFA